MPFRGVLIFFLFLFSLARASQETLAEEAFDQFLKVSYNTALAQICEYWMIPAQPISVARAVECDWGVRSFSSVLDFEMIRDDKLRLAMAFRSKFNELMGQHKTLLFLQQLDRDLDNIKLLPMVPDTLMSRLKTWFPNAQERLEFMAVIFQDTSAVVTPLVWADRTETVFSSNQQSSLRLMQSIFHKLENSNVKNKFLKDFPNYHSYVPAYVAQKLAEKGLPVNLNFTMSYGFNYLYELAKLRTENMKPLDWFQNSVHRNRINVTNIFAAYQAFHIVLGVPAHYTQLDEFTKDFRNSHNRIHQDEVARLSN